MPLESMKLLIVDDNQANCMLLEEAFSELYDVHTVHSGKDCIEEIEQNAYDIVLLDIGMPEMNGYEVCAHIKANPATALTPIVFVSAFASPEERLKGYELGAEDYVTKPFKVEDICQIVANILDSRMQVKNLEKQSQEAMTTAFQAMTNSAELGTIIQFMKASYEAKNVDQLAQTVTTSLNKFGLRSCLMFNMENSSNIYGCSFDSIEAKVLERFYQSDRILDFGARSLINDKHVSLLVLNMPLDKPDDYGRIKDNLIALVNGTEARCKSLSTEQQLETARKQGFASILEKSNNSLDEITRLVNEQKESADEVLESLHKKIESIVFNLGLDEAQEKNILEKLETGLDAFSLISEYSVHIQKNVKDFVDELQNLA